MANASEKLFTYKFWLLCLSSFLFFGSFNLIIPELPDYLTSLGGGDHKGLIIPLFTLMAGISRPFSGKLTDNIGRIPVMVYGVLVCIVCGILYTVWTGVIAFFIIRLIHGMSTGFKPTATSAYVSDVSPFSRRGEAMGILGMSGSLGMAAGPVIGSFVALNFGYNAMFITSSVVALLSIVVIGWMPETLFRRRRFDPSLLKLTWEDVFDPKVWKPALIMLLTTYSFGVILTLIPDLSKHLGIENKGLFFAFFTMASLLARLLAGKLSDQYGRELLLMLGCFILALTMYYIGIVETKTQLFLLAGLVGIAAGINSPTVFAWTIDLAEDEKRGRALATVFISMEVGIGLGGAISGYSFANKIENFPEVFGTAAVLAGIATVSLIFFYRDYLKTKRTVRAN